MRKNDTKKSRLTSPSTMLSFPKWMNVKSLVITGKNGIWNTNKFSLLTGARSFIASSENSTVHKHNVLLINFVIPATCLFDNLLIL